MAFPQFADLFLKRTYNSAADRTARFAGWSWSRTVEIRPSARDASPVSKLRRASVALCLAGGIVAAGVLAASGVGLSVRGVVVTGIPMILLAALIFYGSFRPLPFVASFCHGMAVVLASGILAGTIAMAALALGTPLVDSTLAAIDRVLFGVDATTVTELLSRDPAVIGGLAIVYMLSSILVVPLMLLLAWWRRYERVAEAAFLFAFTILFCAIVSVAAPAIGAFTHLGMEPAVLSRLPADAGTYHLEQFNAFRDGTRSVVDWSNLIGVITVPSFHTCLALIPIWATRDCPGLCRFTAAFAVLTLLSILPIGGHYLIDVLAGTVVTALAIVAACRVQRSAAVPSTKQPSVT